MGRGACFHTVQLYDCKWTEVVESKTRVWIQNKGSYDGVSYGMIIVDWGNLLNRLMANRL